MQLVTNRYEISDINQIDMLRKLALYWDGQWFLNTVDEFGLDIGIAMNARVRAAFGRVEMRTLLKSVRKKKAENLQDAMLLIKTYLDVFMGKRLKSHITQESSIHSSVLVTRCPAFEGAKRAGYTRSDQACVACKQLWPVWLESLLPGQKIGIQVFSQLGNGDANCQFIIHSDQTT